MLSSRMIARGAICAVLIAVSSVLSQVTPSISTNPLGTSSFTTPFFSPTQTYTITSTFPLNTPVTQTTISGSQGPSPASSPYTFSYSIPLQSATPTNMESLFSSLQKAGFPTAYTSAFQPNPTNLQIVDGSLASYRPTFAVLFTMGAGVIAGLFYL